MTTMTDGERMAVEAAAFRTLLKHLAHRTDVQNVDLMAVGGFCRNCLAEWYQSAAKEVGVELDKEAAREAIYGLPYGEWKAQFQSPASEAQLAAMKDSLRKNEGRGF
ncbi:hypothetical protein GCM10007972_15430 [Iodidimonas muriae]|uniref:SMc04008-like domain-containing protein n=2 Tax=Iodidimonas muriae TaxID=261467 RepID=A0ABQ2LDA1_9PROT|nr:DUF1244 domain-containing protein [Iodidimonas muriae]GER07197.1 hypothetical protein JCM17843_15070 [Kordiimonadales bacterium JCM 17843]GGO11555.1 hypothetical protein GCM10007972_15430 [Iodidimonas muriae]